MRSCYAATNPDAPASPRSSRDPTATLGRRTTSAVTITEREVEVLELLPRGPGNKEMARGLSRSEATVKSHLSHVCTKLGVDTRAGAVAAATERRIIRS
jgi:DNA-binding NarL/FixJ family response regulator